jgi:hypothetical protein
LANVDAPPTPAADPIWRRAGRTRIRRRAALAAAAVVLGAAALALTTLPTQPIIGPAGPPADGGVGGLEPLPPRLTPPIGQVPTTAQRPTDRVQLLVETKLFERRFFYREPACLPGDGCSDHSSPWGWGRIIPASHRFAAVSGQILLAPDGGYAAAVVSPLVQVHPRKVPS